MSVSLSLSSMLGSWSWSWSLWLSLVPLLLVPSGAEIRTFNGKVEADASFIHYSEGFIIAPGSVDISDLVFSTIDNELDALDDDEFYNTPVVADDVLSWNDTLSESASSSSSSSSSSGVSGENSAGKRTQVEIILFHEPSNCSKHSKGSDPSDDLDDGGCDWTHLGVGAEDRDGNLRWCCWDDAIDLGLCSADRPDLYGKLITDPVRFRGQYRSLAVSPTGHQELTLGKAGSMPVDSETGRYFLVLANCDPRNGRDLHVSGRYVWKSRHGYLPGNLFGELYFFFVLTALYALLLGFYATSMAFFSDSRIPIQNYIVATIAIGTMEVFFRAGDYWVWNEDGIRFPFAMYTGIFLGVIKRTVSRCLIVMVGLGWGVVRDDLGGKMCKIYTLGTLYFVAAVSCDVVSIVFSAVENRRLGGLDAGTDRLEDELFDLEAVLLFVLASIDVCFYMWVLDSLTATMTYLENMGQHRKLQRYLRLRLVFLLSVLFAVVWATFTTVDRYKRASTTQPVFSEQNEWSVQAAWEVNYFLVLAAVSFLWKPDAAAKDYAFVMELPSIGPGDDDDEHDMVLNTNADCMDDDDDDDNVDDNEQINNHTNREGNGSNSTGGGDTHKMKNTLKIDDAVDA